MKNILPYFNRDQKGFVILFTMLIATIILMIGFGIFSVAIRETVLSGTAREAQKAFYAADAGVECALYADSSTILTQISAGGYAIFTCGVLPVKITDTSNTKSKYEFDIQVSTDTKSCAHVTIFNGLNSRRVLAQGYNVCNADKPSDANPLLVERDLDVKYPIGGAPATPPSSTPPPQPPSSI